MYDLKHRVAFITGGAQGIGRAIAVELAKAGADIVIAQRDINKVADAIEEIKSIGREALAVQVDVTDKLSIKDGVKKALGQFDTIDILVNNAGYAESMAEATTLDDLDRCYDVNLKGVWRVTSELVPHFKANKSGKIINISSTAGRIGSAELMAYGASKAALNNLTQSLACELGPYKVNVNAICPALIRTEMSEKTLPTLGINTSDDYDKFVKGFTLLNCVLVPEDVANAVVFFASPASNNITGQILNVDGGGLLNSGL